MKNKVLLVALMLGGLVAGGLVAERRSWWKIGQIQEASSKCQMSGGVDCDSDATVDRDCCGGQCRRDDQYVCHNHCCAVYV